MRAADGRVEASNGQLEDEVRLALSHAGVHDPPRIESVRRYAAILPQQDEVVRHVRDGSKEALMSIFYDKFERHAGAGGPQGSVHALLPGLRTWSGAQVHGRGHRGARHPGQDLAISPVGCSVFLYYYFDVGNSQAAHGGRRPWRLGHKFANPDSIVIQLSG